MPRPLLAILLALAAACAAACAAAPPVPPPPPPRALAPGPPVPILPPSDAERLDEAARLLADGAQLERASLLLAAVAPGPVRRDLLVGQLAELSGDDAGAVAAYERVLAAGDDEEVRLRRALALERLGRGPEAAPDLHRLRAAAAPRPAEGDAEARPARKLRPLRPSSR